MGRFSGVLGVDHFRSLGDDYCYFLTDYEENIPYRVFREGLNPGFFCASITFVGL
jgi:hypothetical protein